jgi:flavin-dependent dehydrogenase
VPTIADEYDVIILGSGLASLCLTRLLSLELPELRVLSVDRGQGPSRRVGESTVEIGAHFLHTRLQLADTLSRTQLPKNGLRYWFDDEARSLPFDRASEDGPATFSYWRSYQLERETFERLLLRLNLDAGQSPLFGADGVEVLPPASDGDATHRVGFSLDGQRHEVTSRWLVDATGRSALLAERSGCAPDPRLSHSACWMWFEGAKRVDDLVPEHPARPCFGPRLLSTNHLLYEGYWIWLIPLASGLLSVGLVYDHTVLDEAPRDQAGLLQFLRSHRMLADLLADATPVGFGQARDYARRPQQFINADRTAFLGLAAGFADPFYSNGIDMVALACDALADVIRRDRQGLALEAERLRAHNRNLELFYEQVVMFVSGLYATFASHELSVIRYRRDVHVYWTLYTWAYMAGKLCDLEFLGRFLPAVDASLEQGRFFARLLKHTYGALKQRGTLRRDNKGRYAFNQLGFRNFPYVRFEQQLGEAPDLARCQVAVREIDTGCFLALMDSLFDGDRSPLRRLLFDAVYQRYDRIVALEAEHGGFTPAYWAAVFALLSEGVREGLAAQGLTSTGFELTPAGFGRVLPQLLTLCDSPEAEAKARQLYHELPALQDFDDMQATREDVQPPCAWSVEHTPWLDAPLAFDTVYELLGDAWLKGQGGTLTRRRPSDA